MPFLHNVWYAAFWTDELSDKPLARTVLGKPLVFYRGTSGAVIALSDTCPHRFAPLHLGKVTGDGIACPYHGLQFGPDGRCVHNPHGPVIGAARVDAYPLAERYGVHWIWIGADEPNLAALPDVPELEDQTLAWVHGTIEVAADYRLVVDNLMDLSHVEFMHPMLGSPGSSQRVEYEARVNNDQVRSTYRLNREPTSGNMRLMWPDAPDHTRFIADMRWTAPCNLVLATNVTTVDGDVANPVLRMPTTHFLTPETETTTHYLWAAARNTALDNPELSERRKAGIIAAFKYEDEPMLAAVQQRLALLGEQHDKPLLLKTDMGAVLARRVLEQQIAKQASL
jgi:vanillate O-demethylase monooxygenase subunit